MAMTTSFSSRWWAVILLCWAIYANGKFTLPFSFLYLFDMVSIMLYGGRQGDAGQDRTGQYSNMEMEMERDGDGHGDGHVMWRIRSWN